MNNMYTLIDYFDVWTNEEGLYYVNDQTVINDHVAISDNIDDSGIIDILIDLGYLNAAQKDNIYINCSDSDFIELLTIDKDYPICCLTRNYY